MTRKLTITIDDAVYRGLYKTVGKRRISRFLEDLARPHVTDKGLEAAYREMAADERRETGASEWCENLVSDVPARYSSGHAATCSHTARSSASSGRRR